MPLITEHYIIKGIDKTDTISSCIPQENNFVITFNNGKVYTYNSDSVKIIKTALSPKRGMAAFEYITKIADIVGLKDDNGNNTLTSSFERITSVENDCILANYLNGKIPMAKTTDTKVNLFPFGFNLSQKQAVHNACTYSLSVIEGPPGTGKTQTILNIIATALMDGKSVAVVSNNNAATKNVYDKLQRYGLEFLAACLGSSDNKKEFLKSQQPLLDLSPFVLSDDKMLATKTQAETLHGLIITNLAKQNALAGLISEREKLSTEYTHFQNLPNFATTSLLQHTQNTTSAQCIGLWHILEQISQKRSKITQAVRRKIRFVFRFVFGKIDKRLYKLPLNEMILHCQVDSCLYIRLWHALESISQKRSKITRSVRRKIRLVFRIIFGKMDKLLHKLPLNEMIVYCQTEFYRIRQIELDNKIHELKTALKDFDFEQKMNTYTDLCMQVLKATLAKHYAGKTRRTYDYEDLYKRSSEFIADYPIILSTTYSLYKSLGSKIKYDYVIVDESSQVDIVTGALALLCAKCAVIVGDRKQLSNVVDDKMVRSTNAVFLSANLPEVYNYATQSLLSSITTMFPKVPKVLLREHYRCNPKIIGFCNDKFYDGQLILLTATTKAQRTPLIVYKTVACNLARGTLNQRQINLIRDVIIPEQKLVGTDLGITTPYRLQTDELQKTFEGQGIKADTVDKFQGQENDIIILSTVDNAISEFADNSNRLNVAVSRAKEQLIVVVNGNEQLGSNIRDLVAYAQYNNCTTINSTLNSVFDYLYAAYDDQRKALLSTNQKISEYDSENLLYIVIMDVLKDERLSKYSVALHKSLSLIIKDVALLTATEKAYALNPNTHLDFLIYNKLSKMPVLAIEVDGTTFHKAKTRQYVRDQMKDSILHKYGLPLLRLRTDGSAEQQKITDLLLELSQ